MNGCTGYTRKLGDVTRNPDESAMVRYVRAVCAHRKVET